MLRKIEIANYRGIRTGIAEGFGLVNLFVGPNGSGKSTLLESIFLGAGSPPISNPDFLYSDGRHLIAFRRNESDLNEIAYKKERNTSISVTYHFDDSQAQIVKKENEWFHWASPPPDSAYFSNMKLLDIHILLDKLTEQRRWDELLNVRGDREIIKVMNRIYPIDMESFTYSVNSQTLKVLFHNRDFALNIDDLGVGMRTAFRFFMSILLTRNSAALAEEFDGYQYTESFPRFVKVLFELSSVANAQLFLTTHGHETIRVFVEQARKSPSIDLKIFQTDLSIDGIFRTACFSLDDAESLMAGGFDIRRTR